MNKVLVYKENKDLYFKLDTDNTETLTNFCASRNTYYNLFTNNSFTKFYISLSLVNLYGLNDIKDFNGKFYRGFYVASAEYNNNLLNKSELISFIEVIKNYEDSDFMGNKEGPIILKLLELALYN